MGKKKKKVITERKIERKKGTKQKGMMEIKKGESKLREKKAKKIKKVC